MADLKQLADQLVNLTVREVKELADILKSEYGIEPAAAAAVAMAPAAGTAVAAVEQTEFDVILKDAPADAKLKIVKEVKTVLNLGLKEAKDLVDGAPATLKEKVSKAEAEQVKAALEAVGAVLEIK